MLGRSTRTGLELGSSWSWEGGGECVYKLHREGSVALGWDICMDTFELLFELNATYLL